MKRRTSWLLAVSTLVLVAGGAIAQVSPGGLQNGQRTGGNSAITAEQRAMLNEKLLLINQIVRSAGADRAGQYVTPEQQRWLLESLYQMPLTQIRAMRPSGSVDGVVREMTKAKAAAPKLEQPAIGQASTELVYYPFTPCRFIDTRNVGGKISGARGFDFFLAGDTYGGAATCNLLTLVGVPTGNEIAAIALNMTIVDTSTAASPGFATARPAGATGSTALVNWTVSSAGFQLGNAAVVSTDQGGAANELEIFTSGAVHAIVDFNGAFAAPTATALDCTLIENTVSIPAGGIQGFSAACAAGRLANGGGCYANSFQSTLVITGNYVMPALNGWGCDVRNPGAAAQSITARASCCRIPGR